MLGTSEKQRTTVDALFTVETVACLGACGLAPVLVIDEQVYGSMTPERATALVDDIKMQENTGDSQAAGATVNGEAHVN
jgi:NADH-quinone oxidoreductase subunit E